MNKISRLAILCSLMMVLFVAPAFAKEKVYVFAAASTTNVVKALIDAYQQESGGNDDFLTSFASSSTLARQIDAGADADIYISANVKWFDWLNEKGMVEENTGSIMAANSLVLISPADQNIALDEVEKLPEVLGQGYLAMGDVSNVPAGMYGKESLDFSGLWQQLSSQIAQYSTVRVALNAVETEQAEFGIVYKTDALSSKKVKVVYTFAADSHTPIEYPICAIKGQLSSSAANFLNFMKTEKAKQLLDQFGFTAR